MLFFSRPAADLSILWAEVNGNDPTKVNILLPVKISPMTLTPGASGFSLLGKVISSVAIAGSIITLTVSVPYAYGDSPSLSYAVPAVNAICDDNGRRLASFSSYAVLNNIGNTVEISANFVDRTANFNTVSADLYSASGSAPAFALTNQKIPAGCSGYIAMDYVVSGGSINQSASLGFRSSFTNDSYLLIDFCGVTSTGTPNQVLRSTSSATFTGAGYTLVTGDTRWRIRRDAVARIISLDSFTAGSWVNRYSAFPYYDGDLWCVAGVNVVNKQLLNPKVLGTVPS